MQHYKISHTELSHLVVHVLQQDGCFRFQAHGRSMHPFIRDGDVLLIQAMRSQSARIGDVLLYQTDAGHLIAHRLIRKDAATWLIRSDRLWVPFEHVRPSQVLGRVIAVERKGQLRSLFRLQHRLLPLLWIWMRPFCCRCWLLAHKIKVFVVWLRCRLKHG